MKKSAIEASVTGVLAALLAVLVLTKLTGRESTRNPKSEIPDSKSTQPPPELLTRIEQLKATATQADPKMKEKQKERAALPWGRDPFVADAPEKTHQDISKPSLVCKGISCMEGEPVALLNYAVVREGEEIEGYIVEQIAKDKVVLGKGGRTYVLRVGEE